MKWGNSREFSKENVKRALHGIKLALWLLYSVTKSADFNKYVNNCVDI